MPKRPGIEGGSQGANSERPPRFQAKLQEIISQPLTPGNIGNYFDNALSDLTELIDQITHDYKQSHSGDLAEGAKLEDKAFEYFNLRSIPEVLSIISKGKENVEIIDKRIDEIQIENEIYVPPITQAPNAIENSGSFEVARIFDRVRVLLYILKEEGIPIENKEAISITQGVVSDQMLRRTSYTKVSIPELNRSVLVCDEENNATYVFDNTRLISVLQEGQDIVNMTKEDLASLIRQNPGIGVRFIYGSTWRNRLQQFLTSDLEEITPRIRHEVPNDGIPEVSKGELDPWKGFWTDLEMGKHWGSTKRIMEKLAATSSFPISGHFVRRRIEDAKPPLPQKKIRNFRNETVEVYSIEDVASLIEDRLSGIESTFQFEGKEGEWAGFYTNTEGLHLGSLNLVLKKLGVATEASTALRIIEQSTTPVRKIELPRGDRTTKLFCYEDVEPLFEEIRKVPRVDLEGEWRGFYTNEEGKHYATINVICEKLHITKTTFNRHLKEKIAEFTSIQVRGTGNREDPAYCFEEIEPFFRYLTSLPQAAESGEWANFVKDEDGRYYGTLQAISPKIVEQIKLETNREETAERVYSRLVRLNVNELKSIFLRDVLGHRIKGYTVEDVATIYKEKFPYVDETPSVEMSGEWKGFYEYEGEHYGTPGYIAKRVKMNEVGLRQKLSKDDSIRSIEIKNVHGKRVKGYSFEQLRADYIKRGKIKPES